MFFEKIEKAEEDENLKRLKSELETAVSVENSPLFGLVSISATQYLTIEQIMEIYPNIIWTFTPGPVVPEEIGLASWLENKKVVGCSNQLSAFNLFIQERPDFVVIAVNSALPEAQMSKLKEKSWNRLLMLSDPNFILAERYGLKTLKFKGMNFYARQSSIDNLANFIDVLGTSATDPTVNPEAATRHLEALKHYIPAANETLDEIERSAHIQYR